MEKTCPGWTGLSPARATLPYPHLYSWKKLWVVIGTLSKDDDDGSENVAKKMNLRSFKLNRVYLDPLKMSNAGDFSWSWILKDFIHGIKKRKENSSSYGHVLNKTST